MTTWHQFNSIPNGTRVYNHGWDQCVALANLYHESVIGGKFIAVGSAFQWWTTSQPELNRLYTRSSSPVAGAIFVARYGIYDAPNGHIGVVVSVNGDGSFNTMEQNAGTWRYVGRYRRGMQNILGFLLPKDNPASTSTVSKPKHKKGSDMLIRDEQGGMFVVDDFGRDSIVDFRSGMPLEELIYSAQTLWGSVVQVNNRQRDVLGAVANARWAKKSQEIANKVPKSNVDNAAISDSVSKSVIEALNKSGVSVDQATVQKAVRAELDKTKLTG